ncbi:SUMF1/EgtB/PvdO family nonheme iron enzyme [Bdellovibrio sp.]|uniref:glycoside hydrolase family 78 protein n=1 Tax=Bdellovibrio sp. TaxID=28201 RepID=UPI0039E35083
MKKWLTHIQSKSQLNLVEISKWLQLGMVAGLALILSACDFSASLLSVNSKYATSIDSETTPTYINNSNQSHFPIAGHCPQEAKEVVLEAQVTTTLSCVNGQFSSSLDLSALPEGKYSFILRPDVGEPETWVVEKDITPPTITGLSDDPTWKTSKTWNWGCSEICTYRSVVDTNAGTAPSGEYGSSTTSSQTSESGTYYLHVQAQDQAGNTSITHVSALLDNTKPTAPTDLNDTITINSLTQSPSITFTDGTDAHSGVQKHQLRVLRVADNFVIKDWHDFSNESEVTGLTLATNTYYKVEVKTLDNLNQESLVTASDGWLADTTPPTNPTGLATGSVPNNFTDSPPLSWTASTDVGGSGVTYYEVKVQRSADDALIKGWTVLANGGTLTGLSLSRNTSYYFKVRASDNAGNLSGESAIAAWTTDPCPTNYILVPALAGYTTQDFCVARYEMKNVGGVATSQATGNPWVSINRDTSRTQCTNLGGTYDLISNAQWQTIARNIETVPSNWSSGIVGTGTLARGWAANTLYGDTWTNPNVAPSTDANCLYNTGAGTCASTGSHLYRRTHTLTNGKVLWDFSGNVWEWTRDNYEDLGVDPEISAASQELNTLSATNIALFSSATDTWSSTQGLGQAYGSSAGGVLRGGNWNRGAQAGVFAVSLGSAPSSSLITIGFRCVFVP